MNKDCSTHLWSRAEAARYLGIAPNTLAVWACNGRYDLPFVKIGRRAMYRAVDIERFIEANVVMQEAV